MTKVATNSKCSCDAIGFGPTGRPYSDWHPEGILSAASRLRRAR